METVIDYNLLGKRIKEYRIKNGYTQEKLAEIINVSTTFISRIERGNAKTSLEVLAKICLALDVSPGLVLSGTFYESENYLRDDISKMLEGCPPYKINLVNKVIKTIIEESK